MTNEEIIHAQRRALLARDWEAFTGGFAESVVMFIDSDLIVGNEAIRARLAGIPEDALPKEVIFDSVVTHGEYTIVAFHYPEGVRGYDTFHIRDGKIVMQAAHLVDAPLT